MSIYEPWVETQGEALRGFHEDRGKQKKNEKKINYENFYLQGGQLEFKEVKTL